MRARVVLLAAVVASAVVSVSAGPARSAAPEPEAPTVEWGGRTFESDRELARWLRERGATYYTWATRHPQASAALERGRPAGQDVTELGAVEATAPGEPFVSVRTAAVLAAVGFALLLLLAAFVPERLVYGGPFAFVAERRLEIVALAVALAIGSALTLSL